MFKGRTGGGPPGDRFKIFASVAAAGVAVCGAAVALTLSGQEPSNPALDAELRAAVIAAPIAIGLYVWNRDPWRRFGKLLVAAGFALALATLAQSSSSVLYSTGRVFGWFVEPLLVFLVLAFPSGRLTTRSARYLVAASLLLVAALYLPTALLIDSYPTPAPSTSCNADCPANAFMLVGGEPGFIGGVIVPLREIAAIVLFAAVVALLATRIKRGTALMRITLVPVLAVAIVHALSLGTGLVVRHFAPNSTATDVLMAVITLSYGGVAIGFLVGLCAWRMFENRALRRVSTSLASHPPALSLRETSELLAETMDPSLQLYHKPPDRGHAWLNVDGWPTLMTSIDERRCVTEIVAQDGHLVAVVHDPALKDVAMFVAITRSSVLKALANERLGDELRDSLRELRESRARIMSSADKERQRIEQDLHDGAQQSLVALRIRLELAGDLLGKDPARAEQLLAELATQVDGALEEVRSLARGVYPSLLSSRGLGEALNAAAIRSPVPTAVDANGIGRYRSEVEAAAYFCCLEAMQNAMKHAQGVRHISVSLEATTDLRFEVRDDGAGFLEDEVRLGAGLTSMRDRLAAVGGRLVIRTAPGEGTCVSGTVPLNQNGDRLPAQKELSA